MHGKRKAGGLGQKLQHPSRERERDVIEFLAVYFFSVAIDEFGLCYSALLFALHFERGKHERMEDKKPSFRFHSLHELAKTFE